MIKLNKQDLRNILVQHIAEDKESHAKLVDTLTEYVASNPGDYEDLVSVFVEHVEYVGDSHEVLLELLDNA